MFDFVSLAVFIGSFILFQQAQQRNVTWLWVATVGLFAAITLWSAYGFISSFSPMSAISVLICGFVTKHAFDRSGLRYRLRALRNRRKGNGRRGGRR